MTGGGKVWDKFKEGVKEAWAIANDPSVQNAAKDITGKVRNMLGKGEREEENAFEDFINNIYIDLDDDVREFNETLHQKISKYDAVLENEQVFRQCPKKCRTVFKEAYEYIMSNNPQVEYTKKDLDDFTPSKCTIQIYNNYLLDQYINDMDMRIKFEKNNGYETVKLVDKLIEKYKSEEK